MTKLEWCRTNAPDAIKNLPDDQLLELMEQAFNSIGINEIDQAEFESVEYNLNNINNHLDYMVLELVRVFGNTLAFKGGYLLTKLIPDKARQTTDIDFSINNSDVYEKLKDELITISLYFINLGVIDDYKVKEEVLERKSGGVDFYKDGRKILGVDVGLHRTNYGTRHWNLDIGTLSGFEVERMLADKISAILYRKRFRRPKDLYDLYCISESFDFKVDKVRKYILLRTDGLGADWDNYPFSEEVQREYKKAYDKLILDSIYQGIKLGRPSFEIVIERFNIIADCIKFESNLTTWKFECKHFV